MSTFSGLESSQNKKQHLQESDEQKELAESQAKVTKFSGLQSTRKNIITVDSKEKDELLKSKLVSQAKDNYTKATLTKQGTNKTNRRKINVDTDAVGKAAAAGKNIWKQMEKEASASNTTPTPRKPKSKRKQLVQVSFALLLSFGIDLICLICVLFFVFLK